jgi:nucleotide-binding universal stress UspA family protein
MSQVLAVFDTGGESKRVTDVATAIALVGGMRVRVLQLARDTDPQVKAEQVLAELAAAGTAIGVLASAGPKQGLGWRVAKSAEKPVVLVPGAGPDLSRVITRVLVPLDGTAASATAVEKTIELLAHAGVDILVLHVFETATVPKFWDQPAHAEQVWRSEFMARYCDRPGIRFELRRGEPGQQVLDVATAERVDLIALAWSRTDETRARTVRRAVGDARVPVMLMPVFTSE